MESALRTFAPRRLDAIEEARQKRALVDDEGGEEHYNVISAFIKSLRDSDPDAAMYWLMRMVEAGEDPLFIARRMVILAAEDVGSADPGAATTSPARTASSARSANGSSAPAEPRVALTKPPGRPKRTLDMVARILVTPFVALLVALHGVPLAALAPLAHCPQEAGVVKEGDHCERKPVRKEAPCPHHRRDAGHGAADGGPEIHSAACSCGHSALAAPAVSDPLLRPRAVEAAVVEPSRSVPAALFSGDGVVPAAPPSPPPRGLLS